MKQVSIERGFLEIFSLGREKGGKLKILISSWIYLKLCIWVSPAKQATTARGFLKIFPLGGEKGVNFEFKFLNGFT